MYSKEAFETMTVIELRQIARENGVKLSAGISKQGIVERLVEALAQEEAPVQTPAAPAEQPEEASAPEQPAPVHRSASFVADDEDTPVLTPNVPFNRAAAPSQTAQQSAARPAQPAANRGNVPGTNKPAFTLEGARAWHNPRSYQQQSSPFTQRAGAGFTQQRTSQGGYGQPRVAQRPAGSASRFGPDAVQPAAEEAMPAQEPPMRYNAPYQAESRPAAPYNGGYQSDYRGRRESAPQEEPAEDYAEEVQELPEEILPPPESWITETPEASPVPYSVPTDDDWLTEL